MSLNQKTAISILQEYCTRAFLPTPKYEFASVASNGQASGHFKCFVLINSNLKAEAIGSSKQSAKQQAAKNILEAVNIPVSPGQVPEDDQAIFINATGELNEFCSKNGFSYPSYSESANERGQFVVECQHLGYKTFGLDMKKKQAKQKASNLMLQSHSKNRVTETSFKEENKPPSRSFDEYPFSVEDVIKKYKDHTPLQKAKVSTASSKMTSSSDINIHDRSESVKTLVKIMDALDIKYDIKTIQDSPCILGVQFSFPNGNNETIMQKGYSYDEVLKYIFQSGLDMYTKNLVT